MKKIFFSIFVSIVSPLIIAQVPESFNYQAIVRNTIGEVLGSQTVSFRFSILKGNASGTGVYSEKHATSTNQFGLISVVIGNGTDKIGNLSSINWGEDIYFLKTEVDPAGGTSYVEMGTTQLLSVPYAMYSKSADYNSLTNKPIILNSQWSASGSNIYFNAGSVGVGTTNPNSSAALEVSSTTKGVLLPRMTSAQIVNISNPADGLFVFNITTNTLNFFSAGKWFEFTGKACFPQPTIANAGPDKTEMTASAILEGNTPEFGTGTWSIVSGTGGVFDNPDNPTTSFSGTFGQTYTLKWTISNSCNTTSDNVGISFIKNHVVLINGVRQWSDGTCATSANGYLNPSDPNYEYLGDTGDGLYKIQAGAEKIDVWCEMTGPDPGWMMVLLNSQYPIAPQPNWNQVVNNVNTSGTYGTDGLSAFDLFLGVKYWNMLGTKMRLEMGNASNAILRRATYDFNLNVSNFYSLNLSNQVIQIGNKEPGIYTDHNGMKLSTFDLDNDTYTGNCSSFYNNTAWWYKNCWSGSFWGGGGEAMTNNPYWWGSADVRGENWFPWGAIWVK